MSSQGLGLAERAQQINFKATAFLPEDWAAIEDWFTDALQAITIPPSPQPSDIQRLTSQIDYVASKAAPLFARMKGKYESTKQQRELAEEQTYLSITQSPPELNDKDGKPIKLTVDLTKALRTEFLMNNPLNYPGTPKAMPASIFILERASHERYTFMDVVMKELRRKQDALITDMAAIKIEASVGPAGEVKVA